MIKRQTLTLRMTSDVCAVEFPYIRACYVLRAMAKTRRLLLSEKDSH